MGSLVLSSSPSFPKARSQRQHQQARLSRRSGYCVAQKMYVPSDSFGGKSPERKAADALCKLFTFAAARVVQAQLEPTAAAGHAAYNASHYNDLMYHLHEYPMKDAEEWLARLMRKNQMLAVRIMEVRKAYCEYDFEWAMCKSMSDDKLNASNQKLMQKFALENFEKAAMNTETPKQNQ